MNCRIAGNVLSILKIDCPIDPGQWSVEDVCDWMLNQKVNLLQSIQCTHNMSVRSTYEYVCLCKICVRI